MSGGGGGGSSEVKDTPEQKYNAQVAAEKWNYAQDELAPLENQYMSDVDNLNNASKKSYIRGVTNQSMQQGLSSGLHQSTTQLGQQGIDPSSGRGFGTETAMTQQAATQGGDAMARGLNQQDRSYAQGLNNIVAIGQGQEGQATNGLSDVANASVSSAIDDSQQSFSRNQANLQLLGSVAGAGTAYGLNSSQGAQGGTNVPEYSQGTGLNLYGN